MALPFFYKEDIAAGAEQVILDEDTSKHIVQVLRMQNGEQLQLTDGKGNLFTGVITDNNRKRCAVAILQTTNLQPQTRKISIAISLLKNTSRFEWFLEKATEIGVSEIIPLVCARTEKTAFKYDRMKSILVSAMLQSQQCWLPRLHEPAKFSELVPAALQQQKLIAHCEETGEKKQLSTLQPFSASTIILIGPEGDFTPEEVQLALENNFSAVALGNTRLRTETAGVVAASLLCLV
ncbi:MAG TPA: 16S rRNA (uracil(1498)-N(3))-methyltransferase [Ferruginibacter sp.]|nr:16S rRNA (uracil(1498)-N(3))-methyltransferase [Ferruginibacter sp.]HNF44684.1 16S rRNA (uracil(1498)-N(3))-methyltransferase [Ferruginibacter sp.]